MQQKLDGATIFALIQRSQTRNRFFESMTLDGSDTAWTNAKLIQRWVQCRLFLTLSLLTTELNPYITRKGSYTHEH